MISEGIRRGDLDSLVLPLLTIDEYDSKINNDTSIVIGFYVFEEDAAHDLSNFIERSQYLVLDTDVSPSTTKDGYYVTFVEMQRSPEFANALIGLLKEVSLLTCVDNWQFTCPKTKDDIQNLNEDNLKKYVNMEVVKPVEQTFDECFNFFRDSMLDDVKIQAPYITLVKGLVEHTYRVHRITSCLPKGKLNLSEEASVECLRLERLLSGCYSVFQLDNSTVIGNNSSGKYIIISKTY